MSPDSRPEGIRSSFSWDINISFDREWLTHNICGKDFESETGGREDGNQSGVKSWGTEEEPCNVGKRDAECQEASPHQTAWKKLKQSFVWLLASKFEQIWASWASLIIPFVGLILAYQHLLPQAPYPIIHTFHNPPIHAYPEP